MAKISDKIKQKLIQQALKKKVQQSAVREKALSPVNPEGSVDLDEFTRFDRLPDYTELQIIKAGAEKLRLESPYFRVHEASAGATSRIEGQECINFSSYNYLGLSGDPRVNEQVKLAVDRYGSSVSAARLGAGEREVHGQLESALAGLYGVEAALVFVSGHATNVTTIGHLMGKDDLVIHDEFIHNSIIVGAQLSGAKRVAFKHNDTQDLERILEQQRAKFKRVLIVLEGLYGMDGDYPDLPEFIRIKNKHKTWLMVDEAHSLGTLGDTGRGIRELFQVEGSEVDIWMGTLSKTLAGCGGYIAGNQALIENLKIRAPGFLYSVGMPAHLAAGSLAALKLMSEEPVRVKRLQENAAYFLAQAKAKGMDTGHGMGSAVIPIIIGNSIQAAQLSVDLFKQGIEAQPVVYPGVPEKSARLRFFICSDHTHEQIDQALNTLEKLMT